MDAMRRVLASTSAALLLAAALGCHHTAGMCDCAHEDCWHGYNANHPNSGAPGTKEEPIKPEPIKALPRAGDAGSGK